MCFWVGIRKSKEGLLQMRKANMCRWIVMGAVVLLLVPGSGAAQTTEVHFEGSNATGITNLNVGGTFYDVTFLYDTAENIYGTAPGQFDFSDGPSAEAARDAMAAALNTEPTVTTAGPNTTIEINIAFGTTGNFADVEQSFYVGSQSNWSLPTDADIRLYTNSATYAKFGLSTPTEPATWGRIKALYGN